MAPGPPREGKKNGSASAQRTPAMPNRGDIWPESIDRIALPPARTHLIPLTQVSPTAAAYLASMLRPLEERTTFATERSRALRGPLDKKRHPEACRSHGVCGNAKGGNTSAIHSGDVHGRQEGRRNGRVLNRLSMGLACRDDSPAHCLGPKDSESGLEGATLDCIGWSWSSGRSGLRAIYKSAWPLEAFLTTTIAWVFRMRSGCGSVSRM